MMNKNMKNILWGVLAIAVVVVCAVSFMTSDLEHIADTNGPDDYSLTTITDQDIIDADMGVLNLSQSSSALSSTVKFSSGKFTGVKRILSTEILFSTGMDLQILDFEVNSGNFKMAVVNDGQIIRIVEPGETNVELGAVKGHISLIIAGESADFSFRLLQHDYDSYGC